MTELVLVRHAATAWTGVRYCGRSDPWLSAAGRAEAQAIGEALAGSLPPDLRIVSSPRRRARQTSRAIVARLGGLRIELDDRWAETDFGDAEGRTFDQLARRHPALAASLASGAVAIDFPGGETATDLHARVAAVWRAVVAAGRPALVVTHAGPLRIALALADGVSVSDVAIPPVGAIIRRSVGGPCADAVLPSST